MTKLAVWMFPNSFWERSSAVRRTPIHKRADAGVRAVSVEFSPGNVLTELALDAAIEEMLFTGGALNRGLLAGMLS